MKRALLFLLISLFSSAYAACEASSIAHISADSAEVTLADGSIWEVDPVGQVDSQSWQIGDQILICDSEYIIHQEDGKKVNASLLEGM